MADPAPHQKVLHVVEALGGGVSTALESYLRQTPELTHVVCAWRRPGYQIGDQIDELCRVIDMPAGRWEQYRAVARAVRVEAPDVVHAHSSYAGLYVRLIPAVPSWRVVYSPHCFAFERTDLPRPARACIRGIERFLTYRTRTVAAVGPHEARLARSLNRRVDVALIPHVPDVAAVMGEPDRRRDGGGTRPVTVAALGRVQEQKGVRFLRDAAMLTDRHVQWRWIGGGDAALEAELRDAGVAVTGWLPRREALGELANADIYVHTAAWEGGLPLTILEAAALDLPMVVRRIAPVEHLELPLLVDTPRAMAGHVRTLTDAAAREDASREVRQLADTYSADRQRVELQRLYRHEPRATHQRALPDREVVPKGAVGRRWLQIRG